jgi:ABC-type Mn2+/Zn2+ transport system permease subunit
MIFFSGVWSRLLAGWLLGVVGSAAGITASATWDLPTGASVVTAFGAVFLVCSVVHVARHVLQPNPASALPRGE